MRKKLRLSALSLSFLLVVFGFQNCGEVKFKKQTSSTDEAQFTNPGLASSAISLVDQTVFEGQPVLLDPIISQSASAPSFIWLKDGTVLANQGDSSLSISTAQLTDQGLYEVIYMDGSEELGRAQAQLTVIQQFFGTAPQITSQPQSQSLIVGAKLNLSVVASGDPAPTYQWEKNGYALEGETQSVLTINSVDATDAGSYRVKVTNENGEVMSSIASVGVLAPAVQAPQSKWVKVCGGHSNCFSVLGRNFRTTAARNFNPSRVGDNCSPVGAKAYRVYAAGRLVSGYACR